MARRPRDWATIEFWKRSTVKDYSYGNKAEMASLGETNALIALDGRYLRTLGETVWEAHGVEFHQRVLLMIQKMPAAVEKLAVEDIFVVVVSPKNHPYYLKPLQVIGLRVSGVAPSSRDFHYTYYARWSSEVDREAKLSGMDLEARP